MSARREWVVAIALSSISSQRLRPRRFSAFRRTHEIRYRIEIVNAAPVEQAGYIIGALGRINHQGDAIFGDHPTPTRAPVGSAPRPQCLRQVDAPRLDARGHFVHSPGLVPPAVLTCHGRLLSVFSMAPAGPFGGEGYHFALTPGGQVLLCHPRLSLLLRPDAERPRARDHLDLRHPYRHPGIHAPRRRVHKGGPDEGPAVYAGGHRERAAAEQGSAGQRPLAPKRSPW